MSDPIFMPKVGDDELPKIWSRMKNDRLLPLPPLSSVSGQEVGADQTNVAQQQDQEYGEIGGLMRAIFKDGTQLRTEEDFNTFYLFARIIEQVSKFGRNGMKDAAAIHEVSAFSTVLANRVILHR